jgi:adenylate cyclase
VNSTDAESEPSSASASLRPRAVFLSYASHDADAAQSVCAYLESRGILCWMAPRNVTPGSQYADEIVGAINDAKILVLVLSEHAVASAHVGKELERASSKRRRIIALRTDAAPLTRSFEYFLSESQWIDVAALGMPGALAKLAQAVGQGLAPSSWVSPGLGVDVSYPAARKTKPSYLTIKRLVAAAVFLLVAAVVAGVMVRYWPSKQGGGAAPAVASILDKSIAVLPFVDMSEKKDQEYFADGMAEEVLNRLAMVPGLKVVGRVSSFQFKDKNAKPADIGTALGVAYLLEGSVRKEADRVRVTAQLVEARTGSQRWSDRFDSEVIDVLRVQDTIAAEIARELQITVEVETAPRSSVKSPEVLEAYLRGLHSLARSSRAGVEAAVAQFQQALTLDPTFAPAAIGLARCYVFMGQDEWLPPRIAFERARQATLLARRLDPQNASPHVLMAQIHTIYDWDWAGADGELQQASALGPLDAMGVETASYLAGARGQWEDARQAATEAIALDPLNADLQGDIGVTVHLRTGDFVAAEQSFRKTLEMAPEWAAGHYFLGVALMLQGHNDAALAEFRKETLEDGQLEGSAMVYFATGHKDESDAELAKAIQHNGTTVWPSEIARVYAFRGENDRAFEWLDRAYEMHDEDLYFIKGDPLVKNLQGDPRFKAFLNKMNLPE